MWWNIKHARHATVFRGGVAHTNRRATSTASIWYPVCTRIVFRSAAERSRTCHSDGLDLNTVLRKLVLTLLFSGGKVTSTRQTWGCLIAPTKSNTWYLVWYFGPRLELLAHSPVYYSDVAGSKTQRRTSCR